MIINKELIKNIIHKLIKTIASKVFFSTCKSNGIAMGKAYEKLHLTLSMQYGICVNSRIESLKTTTKNKLSMFDVLEDNEILLALQSVIYLYKNTYKKMLNLEDTLLTEELEEIKNLQLL